MTADRGTLADVATATTPARIQGRLMDFHEYEQIVDCTKTTLKREVPAQ